MKKTEPVSCNCPLCDAAGSRASWLGSTVFRDKEFFYRECLECRSLFCTPMPDADDLAAMYGSEYQKFYATDLSHSGEEGTARVLDFLARREKGVFFDYGCGAGSLLKEAARAGWDCTGFEFDSEIAEKYSAVHDLRIVSELEKLPADFRADVIHLGDVLEHLTDLNAQFPPLLRLLKPGGALVAQGPLEANASLFLRGLQLGKFIKRAPSNVPPYHVTLATAEGQKRFFRRFRLDSTEFSVFEAAHPAPEKLSAEVVKNPRLGILFTLRKISQAVSRFSPAMGNRYFYTGTKNE